MVHCKDQLMRKWTVSHILSSRLQNALLEFQQLRVFSFAVFNNKIYTAVYVFCCVQDRNQFWFHRKYNSSNNFLSTGFNNIFPSTQLLQVNRFDFPCIKHGKRRNIDEYNTWSFLSMNVDRWWQMTNDWQCFEKYSLRKLIKINLTKCKRSVSSSLKS